MKHLISLALVATLLAALSPIAANAGVPVAAQEETGTVLLPSPGPNGPIVEGCWTGWPRRFWIFSGGATAGPFGSMIAIDKKTWNGKFKLEVLSGHSGTEDLDMYYYVDPGKLDPTDPAMQTVVESSSYLTREAGGEVGTVPVQANYAIICLAIGTGANAEWKYTATAPAKKKKK